MGTARIIRFRSCGTPVLVRCAMTSEARQAVSPANRQEPSPESYPCSNRQPSRFRRRARASTRSDSNGTMGTNWEFIPGSFCVMFALARSAGRCEQRRWDKVILCANSEILQEHIPGATSAHASRESGERLVPDITFVVGDIILFQER